MDQRVIEQLNKITADLDREDLSIYAVGQTAISTDLSNSPKYQEIKRILHDRPILVQPTLLYLQRVIQKLAMAELQVLYTPEEIEEMRRQAEEAAK